MKSIEITARTVDEAVKLASEELGVTLEDLKVEVIEESSKGFLGILGTRQAKIRAFAIDNRIKKAKQYLLEIIKKMGITADVIVQEYEDYIKMIITGNNLGIIIGRRGETLDALQYLTSLIANKKAAERKRIILDAEGYRDRREDTLEKLAHRLSDRVKRTGQKVVLEPMNPHERRIIHTTLQNDNSVTTMSEGEEPYRKVVIFPRR